MTVTVMLQPEPTFEAPVEIHVPGKGATPMTWTFRHLKASEIEKIQKKWGVSDVETAAAKAADSKKDAKAAKSFDPVAYLMEFAGGWELKEDFSKRNVEVFFDYYPAAWLETLRVYWSERVGARRKN